MFEEEMLMVFKGKSKGFGLSLLILMICSGWLLHKFYVSLTEIRYNPERERIEVSMRIFPDDLDRALLERSGIITRIGTELEPPVADTLLGNYILGCFHMTVNGEPILLNYLGKEPEADAIWCYLESEPVTTPVRIGVSQTLLTEIFLEQVNIIQVYQERWNRGLLLNRRETSGELAIGQ